MDFKIDMKFYYQVQARFHSVEKGQTIFISVSSVNIDELMPVFFTQDRISEYFTLLREHLNNDKAYVVLDHEDDRPLFFLRCREFEIEQNLITRKIVRFRRSPFIELGLDSEKVRAELVKLGELLAADSEAS